MRIYYSLNIEKESVFDRTPFLRIKALYLRFLCRAHHQTNAIKLVHFGAARVIVDGGNVGIFILSPQLFHHPLSHHMVRQAAERLQADDIIDVFI